jgi:predicted helicase
LGSLVGAMSKPPRTVGRGVFIRMLRELTHNTATRSERVKCTVLLCHKALDEGVDVPEIDMAVTFPGVGGRADRQAR